MSNQPNDASITDLVSDLTRQTSELMSKEVRLAKAEIAENVTQLKTGLIALAAGGVILLASLFYLLDTVVYGLSELLPADYSPWLAALIVSAVLGAVGYGLVKKGQADTKPSNLMPKRAIESLQRDKNLVKEIKEQR